ncbi:sodium:solute symporter family transporter [Leptospira sp. GIMC2001]|uniref:sodium:solute symporter family transporter n=1 Tax=Leptospira sp. GIMC2001 TaxID=1513297 RepID=UPI00234A13DC|nr:sodium:solute symporter [Leptospira sp. GIMC2001]WCL50229.1 sodium:solute symporter [Leptospira sp. GIMC2001]
MYIDLIIILAFFVLTMGLGFYFKNHSTSNNDYFLGGRSIPWWVLSLSLVATETSTLTFLGIPALSYVGDYSFLSLAIGMIIGRIISAIYILPKYISKEYTSIYEWIGDVFGKNSQKSLSALFSLIRILADGVRLYAASLPLSFLLFQFFPEEYSFDQISIISLIIISLSTIFYSAYGGFKAVVWNDFIQFFIYLAGGIICIVLLYMDYGNIEINWNIFHSTMRKDDGNWDPYFFLFSIPGGILLSLGSHGTDQMIVQRLLACRSLAESRIALISSGFIVFVQFVLFLLIGSYLIHALPNSSMPNRVFSEYIVNSVPSPFRGLILAGVFASAMSTLSSTLNSLALTTKIDLNFSWLKKISTIALTGFWGCILLSSSLLPFFLDEKTKSSIVELGLTFSSYVFGPMVALFFLEILNIPKPDLKLKNFFPVVLFLSIALLFLITYRFQAPFTWMVGLGILAFNFIYGLGFGFIKIRTKRL